MAGDRPIASVAAVIPAPTAHALERTTTVHTVAGHNAAQVVGKEAGHCGRQAGIKDSARTSLGPCRGQHSAQAVHALADHICPGKSAGRRAKIKDSAQCQLGRGAQACVRAEYLFWRR